MSIIFHITSREAWEASTLVGEYRTPALPREKFIHCSTADQILIPANALYKGAEGLVLLVIDSERLTADLIYEDCYETDMEFPHIYGPINLAAVIDVVDFPCSADGTFEVPAAAANYID